MYENNYGGFYEPMVQEDVAIETKEYVQERAKYAGDIRKLFLFQIISIVASVISSLFGSDGFSLIGSVASLASFVCAILILVTFWRMGRIIKEYKTSVICSIITYPIIVVAAIVLAVSEVFLTTGLIFGIGIIVILAVAAVTLYGAYMQYKGHSAMLTGIDDEFAHKWVALWRWYLIALGTILVGFILMVITLALGLIIVLVGLVAVIVMAVVQLVYLKKMSDLFADLAIKCEKAAKIAAEAEF